MNFKEVQRSTNYLKQLPDTDKWKVIAELINSIDIKAIPKKNRELMADYLSSKVNQCLI